MEVREKLIAEIELREEINRRYEGNKILSYFPETGPLRRELYPKHMEMFRLGKIKGERLFQAANRIGKSFLGAYETTLHLTGRYPDWWEGRRFDRPISAWAAGQSSATTRNILQNALLGAWPKFGNGMLPRDSIISTNAKPGVVEAIGSVKVRHITGGASDLQFLSYDQQQESFMGTAKDLIWLDEECELGIYSECLLRTMATVPGQPNGIVIYTFTPLGGMTDTVRVFLEAPPESSKVVVNATWDDVPHLSEQAKAELYASIPEYQRKARTRGIAALGSGAIYQIDEQELLVRPFDIPDRWPRAYGLDVGWNRTAACFGAFDAESGVTYLYSEHYRAHDEPHVHSEAIKARGEHLPGFIDPASRGRQQSDGTRLLVLYRNAGLSVVAAQNAVEAGIYKCWQMMTAGQLKVFTSLSNWRKEMALYRRDDAGKVTKQDDHLMDAMRYLLMSDVKTWKPGGRKIHDASPRNPYEGAGFFGR